MYQGNGTMHRAFGAPLSLSTLATASILVEDWSVEPLRGNRAYPGLIEMKALWKGMVGVDRLTCGVYEVEAAEYLRTRSVSMARGFRINTAASF